MPRPRSYIPYPERLAAALACLLPQEQRDDLRTRKVPAEVVISLFQQDHLILHAIGGTDDWWNLDPKIIAAHREKSKRDTSIVAKVKRVDKKWREFTRNSLAKPPKRERKHKWANRPFQTRKK